MNRDPILIGLVETQTRLFNEDAREEEKVKVLGLIQMYQEQRRKQEGK